MSLTYAVTSDTILHSLRACEHHSIGESLAAEWPLQALTGSPRRVGSARNVLGDLAVSERSSTVTDHADRRSDGESPLSGDMPSGRLDTILLPLTTRHRSHRPTGTESLS